MADRASKRVRGVASGGKMSQRSFALQMEEPSPQAEYGGLGGSPYLQTIHPYQLTQPHLQDQLLQQDYSQGFAPPGKILLPPLPRAYGSQSITSKNDKNRTLHACNKCRRSKSKCSGGQPCDKCGNEGKECVYGDGKRDKQKKEKERLYRQNQRIMHRNQQLVNALRNLAAEISPNKARELEELIMSPSSLTDDDDDLITNIGSDARDSEARESTGQGEDDADADVGSPGSLDIINEDTNRDEKTRAAGFMGKSSAVAWVQRAKKAATNDLEDERSVRRSTGMAANGTFTDATYHVEPSNSLAVEIDEVDPSEWPPPSLAKALVDSYFEHVHVAFPILSKTDFYEKFKSFPKDRISPEDQIWMSIANIVFAIGAKFAHLTHADSRGDERDHYVYYARARALGMDHRTLNADPEVQHTTCLGILGLYLLAADQFNRSWTICGIAIRHAMALGLHVRNEANELSDMDKELRVRLWWSLYCLESLLDELTGRPSCISDRDISTPQTINLDESDFDRRRPLYDKGEENLTSVPNKGKAKFPEFQIPTPMESSSLSKVSSLKSTSAVGSPPSSDFTFPMTCLPVTSSTYFIYRTRLSIISHEILAQLYCATLVKAKWIGVQDSIRQIDARLLLWKRSLPLEFDFTSQSQSENDTYTMYRTSLAMFYSSSRMTLFRPCLCRFEGRIERQSGRSKSFDANAAITCVQSARNVLSALPSIEEPRKVYTITAWWNVVHYIIEAASVLMLELAYRAEHLPSQAEELVIDSKKAVMWLRAMSDESIAARKGWEIFNNLLNQVAPKVGGNTDNMPKSAPEPPGWKRRSFGNSAPEVHRGEAPHQTKSLGADRNMNDWFDQSSYAAQQAYSAPAPLDMSVHAAEIGTTPSYLVGPYPFNEVYGRYDEFAPLLNQYYPPSTYPSTTGMDLPGQDTTYSQMGNVEQNQYQEMGDYAHGRYDITGAGNSSYDISRYQGWTGSNTGVDQSRFGEGPSQG